MKKRHQILFYHKQGISQAKILEILKVSWCIEQEIIKKKIKTGDIKERKKSGRSTKLTKSDCKYLKITSLRNRNKSCKELGSDLAQTSRSQVHTTTIWRIFVKEDLLGQVTKKKP